MLKSKQDWFLPRRTFQSNRRCESNHTQSRTESLLSVTQEAELTWEAEGSHWFLSRMAKRLSFKVMIVIAVYRGLSWAELDWEAAESTEEGKEVMVSMQPGLGLPFRSS